MSRRRGRRHARTRRGEILGLPIVVAECRQGGGATRRACLPNASACDGVAGRDPVSAINVVQGDGTWTVTVDAGSLDDGDIGVVANVADLAGNQSNDNSDVVLDSTLPTIAIGTIAGDGITNAAE